MKSLTTITTLLLWDYGATYTNAFLLPETRSAFIKNYHTAHHTKRCFTSPSPSTTHLHASSDTSSTPPPLPDTSDPFLILNLKQPTADKKIIKRAYKRMALKYHPDVRTNTSSTEKERKMANDDFARINAAYAFLTGKSDERPDATESEKKRGASRGTGRPGSASSRSSSAKEYDRYGNTPPHRRTTDYSTDDWKDYMPKYDETYDANGDSFGSIFSDLFSEIGSSGTGGLGGGASILNDFISFLEGNFPSVGSTQSTEEDNILDSLLRDGELEEIKNELDDAKLLVRQLEAKEIDLDSELLTVVKEKEALGSGGSRSYMEEMSLEEKKREIEARKTVVGEYLERARLRQIKLRKRYEELRTEERNSRASSRSGPAGSRSSSSGRSTASEGYSSSSASSKTSSGADTKPDEDAWKTEGFGSSRRRGRGSRGRRSSSSYDTNASSSSSSSTTSTGGTGTTDRSASSPGSSASNNGNDSRSYVSSQTRSTTRRPDSNSNGLKSTVPPHRRVTSSTFEGRVAEDKRRLREIKVDEEIDKMKKELGL